MSAAGYSGTPLVKKLGFKAGMKVVVLGAPEGFEVPGDVSASARLGGNKDMVMLFVTERVVLQRRVAALADGVGRREGVCDR